MKRILLILFFCVMLAGVKAQDMGALFTAMPDTYILQLESAWKKDLVDLYTAGKEARLKNTMEGTSVLKKLTSDYLFLQVSERSTLEMKLLPLVNNTHVICMVTTVSAPIPDSRIEFFSTDWTPLVNSDLYTPVGADWFVKEEADRNSIGFMETMTLLDMDLRKMSLHPDQLTLTVEYTTPQYLSEPDRKKAMLYVKDQPKVYTWEKSHFKD